MPYFEDDRLVWYLVDEADDDPRLDTDQLQGGRHRVVVGRRQTATTDAGRERTQDRVKICIVNFIATLSYKYATDYLL